jgi:hypothetical protein
MLAVAVVQAPLMVWLMREVLLLAMYSLAAEPNSSSWL